VRVFSQRLAVAVIITAGGVLAAIVVPVIGQVVLAWVAIAKILEAVLIPVLVVVISTLSFR